jgi:nitroreductase
MPELATDIWEVMRTARAIRRYRDDPVDDSVILRCLEAATWAPSGGNQQPWRFVLIKSTETRRIIGEAAQRTWEIMTSFYGLSVPNDGDDSPHARVTRTMHHHMMNGATVPVCLLFCVQPQRGATDLQNGGSIFPALQNFSLAARAQGLGTAITLWHDQCDDALRSQVGIPDDWQIASIVTAGWPAGNHGPVNRKPVGRVVVIDQWDRSLAESTPPLVR